MDTSKEYIKMSSEAVEIQKLWKHRAGDLCSPRFSDNITWIVGFNVGFGDIGDKDLIWLPRQDQLQEMLDYPFPAQLVQDFANWCNENHYYGIGEGKKFKLLENLGQLSMEQLWLAFIMKEKYGKTWNGKDWVK